MTSLASRIDALDWTLLLQRLDAFAGFSDDAGKSKRPAGESRQRWIDVWQQRGATWLTQARRIDAVTLSRAEVRPAPNPPAQVRPRQLSVTEIETLMRSPYDIYAKHVLGLRPLDPLGVPVEARERGTIVHDIFGDFVSAGNDVTAPGALDALMSLARKGFGTLEGMAEQRDIWIHRFETAARQFLAFERARNHAVVRRHAEIDGLWDLPLGFALKGRADRVDEMTDGSVQILDFKTGSVPAAGVMRAFEAPQMLLEAAMVRAGAMPGVPAADSSALTYIKIGLGPDAFRPMPYSLPKDQTLMGAVEEVTLRMQRHVDYFLFHDTPMPARLLPLKTQRFPGAYDHLARMDEWTAVEEDEEDLIP